MRLFRREILLLLWRRLPLTYENCKIYQTSTSIETEQNKWTLTQITETHRGKKAIVEKSKKFWLWMLNNAILSYYVLNCPYSRIVRGYYSMFRALSLYPTQHKFKYLTYSLVDWVDSLWAEISSTFYLVWRRDIINILFCVVTRYYLDFMLSPLFLRILSSF